MVIYADNNNLTISLNEKSHSYIKNLNSNYYEYIYNPITEEYNRCFLVYQSKQNGNYLYYCNLTSSSEFSDGIYNSYLKMRDIHIYEYLLYFY